MTFSLRLAVDEENRMKQLQFPYALKHSCSRYHTTMHARVRLCIKNLGSFQEATPLYFQEGAILLHPPTTPCLWSCNPLFPIFSENLCTRQLL